MSDKPVMHGRDHRPGGMDPIPFTAPEIPSAVFTTTISSPITGYLAAQDIEFDTVQTVYSDIFSIVSAAAQLTRGFYFCVGMIQFASAATDWSGVGGGSFAELICGSAGIGTVDLGMTTTISTAATPTYLNHIVATNYLDVTAATGSLALSFAVANNINPLPVGIAVARAVVVRISSDYSITV